MSFFKRLFKRAPEINSATAKIGEQVYLIRYRDHYARVFQGLAECAERLTPRRLAELFLFRAWTTQFGYRIFSSDAGASEKLIGETVNATMYLGLGCFELVHGFSVEEELGSDFLALIEDRWWKYDEAVIANRESARSIPTVAIVSALADQLDLHDRFVELRLTVDFLDQLDLVKRTAIEIGVLAE